MPQFSVCIPNFNYAHYIGDTIRSVLEQDHRDLEVLIADNASTDKSLDVIRGLQANDDRVKLRINQCNVGFAGNLNKSASMASGQWMTMLSSDDLMMPGALSDYARIIDALGPAAETTVLSTVVHVIDGEGKRTGELGPDWKQWAGAEKDARLSAVIGADVWIMPAERLLKNSLRLMRTPFHFATTTYSRKLYDAVEGYSQGSSNYNPDKRFAWALLGVATQAVIIDRPLFSYRIHNSNQDAQQAKAGALKHLTDEYIATFSLPDELLRKAGLSRDEVVDAFIEHDVALRGLLALSKSNRTMARRIVRFGQAVYPAKIYSNRKFLALLLLLMMGPLGTLLAARMKARAMSAWQKNTRAAMAAS